MRIEIVIGLSDRNGVPFEAEDRRVEELYEDITEIAGGLTEMPVKGWYKNRAGITIKEDSRMIIVLLNEPIEPAIEELKQALTTFLRKTNQESAIIMIDGSAEFVTT